MIRTIIEIDREKCTGCGLCVSACKERAIELVNGKAQLIRDDYCDGLGNCLPHCPADAISFVQREAAAYDEQAVAANIARQDAQNARKTAGGCPGSRIAQFNQRADVPQAEGGACPSQLRQWPVQIKLAPITAPYFAGCDLLVAADCTAYAYGSFHQDFIRGRVTLVGCTKLDAVDYTDKLSEILRRNDIRSVTVARMEVPCCGGMERAVKEAVLRAGKDIPVTVHVISIEGKLL